MFSSQVLLNLHVLVELTLRQMAATDTHQGFASHRETKLSMTVTSQVTVKCNAAFYSVRLGT